MSAYLGQLLSDVSANEDSLQVDPEVLHGHPVLDDLGRVGQIVNPRLDLLLERHVVPTTNSNRHESLIQQA